MRQPVYKLHIAQSYILKSIGRLSAMLRLNLNRLRVCSKLISTLNAVVINVSEEINMTAIGFVSFEFVLSFGWLYSMSLMSQECQMLSIIKFVKILDVSANDCGPIYRN
jgi:hypothetical protein